MDSIGSHVNVYWYKNSSKVYGNSNDFEVK